jgi:hypothetical protein
MKQKASFSKDNPSEIQTILLIIFCLFDYIHIKTRLPFIAGKSSPFGIILQHAEIDYQSIYTEVK